MRKPNYDCSECGQPHYVRPNALEKYKHHFCSRQCFSKFTQLPLKKCPVCSIEFRRSHRRVQFCSMNCAQKGRDRTRNKYQFPGKNVQERRFNELKHLSNFDSCMVVGCPYNILYDIHRLIPGADGGKYVIGNMFAICPNHHAEVHRGIITLEKVNDFTLQPNGR